MCLFDGQTAKYSALDFFYLLSSPRRAGTISLPFYRHRAAREQYFCHFIVTVQRGNNIFAILSSPCSAGTIFLSFYRRRVARKRYLCRFIVTVQRGNDILPFYRRRAARERYFSVLSSPCSAGMIFFRFIVAAQRSCKCIRYASEKRADYPAKRQTNGA